jgi:glutamate racemase
MTKQVKIGVFDSGVGGLTVLRQLVRHIPSAQYFYFGDTARLPYGSKSADTVARFAIQAAHFLEERGIDILVIACNTATALALPAIRSAIKVPVEGVVEPGAEAAAAATHRNNVVVIATEATIRSHAYQQALEARRVRVREKACPLFVPLIEEGWTDHAVTERVAHEYLDEFFVDFESGPDALVLGCTHYPLIKHVLRAVAPWRVQIVDSAESTARVVANHLGVTTVPSGNPRFAVSTSVPDISYFATDSVERFQRVGQLFMGHPIGCVEHVDIGG